MNDGKIVKTVFICLILCVTVASVASAGYPYGPKTSSQKNIEIVDLIVSPTMPILDEPIDIVVIVRNNGGSSENVRVVIKSEWGEMIEERDKIRPKDNISHSQEEIKQDGRLVTKLKSCCNRHDNQQNSQPNEVLTNFVGGMPKTSFLSNSSHIYHPDYRRLRHQETIKTLDNVLLRPGESRSVRCRYIPRYDPRDNDILKKKNKSYIISARVTSDHTSHFDSMSKSITVVSEPPRHDLLISSVCDERGRTFYNDEYGNPFSAIKMIEGESRAIRVMIKNESRVFYEDAVVSVKMGGKDGRILGASAVKIGPKEVVAVTISLDAKDIRPGTYELYVEVKPVEGEINLANNSTTKILIAEEKQDRRMKR
ncbi:MAG: hypothetical protein MASP_01012 [Candidatus Methanolliviera sp. GoM_asphalt]|nr:MAG: hypothetical protein MASP_01012 [Candidatus Methanolliviera sp. GoM_asphalt]